MREEFTTNLKTEISPAQSIINNIRSDNEALLHIAQRLRVILDNLNGAIPEEVEPTSPTVQDEYSLFGFLRQEQVYCRDKQYIIKDRLTEIEELLGID